MKGYVDLPEERRRLICEQVAARTGLFAASVEKDFWVVWTLGKLFTLPGRGEQFTFKGGTSLSKVWKLIERFSEDIDLVIHRDGLGFGEANAPELAPSGKQRKLRLEALKTAAQVCVRSEILPSLKALFAESLPEELMWTLEPDPSDADGQTLLFAYPTVFRDHPGYVRQIVKIEMGARSDTEPSEIADIESVIGEMFPGMLSDGRIPVRAVRPERTFWEKAMLLHEETFRTNERSPRKKYMARHYYDLFQLIRRGVADRAADDPDLFRRIAEHREIYFRYAWVDYRTLKPGSLRLVPMENQMADWKADYTGMQREMFYGEVPTFDEVMKAVGEFQQRFNEQHP